MVVSDLNLVTDTDDSALSPPQTIPVQLTARHPDYRRLVRGAGKGVFDDVALIKLARPIQFSGERLHTCFCVEPMSFCAKLYWCR